ncbi:trypsin-like serine protease [Dactylosporangium roseum]|uniref:Trypsin-like serine protease n=1 Tax=Dactylosporangium roseum TaxID=47989 RepID=A0ABY5ZD55_9ACTN|nr:S1 family peptidase [Dactylosporangium roseum]UWZ39352.1 trypsin-like serine protease [Dactylosporangium roseum]
MKRRQLINSLVIALGLTLVTVQPASATPPAPLGEAADAAASQLANDARITAAEARRRIARQDTQAALADRLRTTLGSRFGGAWIDHDHAGRLTVAVVGARSAPEVGSQAAAQRLTDTTTVTVQRSADDLDRISESLGKRLAEANRGATSGLQAVIDVRGNTVRLDAPKGVALTEAQRQAVAWAERQFGGAISHGTYDSPSVPRYCGGQYSCDPPLRSGLAIYMGGGRCTSAFMTYSGSSYYMLTAGHCAEMGSYFDVPTYSYGYQYVGYAVDYDFGYYGDSALVRVEDSSWWQPRGWVYPQTSIRSYSRDYVGQYVCKQGSTTGYTCGQVTSTNATVSYPDRTLTGMTWSTTCVAAGDSGSGVYYGSTAYGILSGGPNSGCGMIHEPITRALSRWGVNLLAG